MITFYSTDAELDEDDEDWDAEFNFQNVLQGVGGAFSQQGPQALSGAAQGAATGASFGGPWGALIGGGVGAAQALFSGKGGGKARPTRPGPAQPARPPAMEKLLQLLSSAPLQQALAGAGSGASSPTVPVGGGQAPSNVPVSALLGLLGSVASQAAEEEESYSDDDSYLRASDGSYRCDPAVDAERNDVLFELVVTSADFDAEMSPEAWLGNAFAG